MTNKAKNRSDTDPDTARQPSKIFLVAPEVDNHTLLEYACVSLASANGRPKGAFFISVGHTNWHW